MWIVYAFASAGFAGLTAILAKIGINHVNSNVATAIRTVVVLAFSWVMVFVVGSQDEIAAIDARTMIFLVLSGLATGGSWLFYFKALQMGEVSRVTPIDKSSTVLTMLLAWIFLGEAMTGVTVIAMVLIGGGTYLMIDKKKDASTQVADDAQSSGGRQWIVYALLAAVFAALTAILGKVGIENVESTLGTAIRTGVVFVMAWLVVWVTRTQGTIAHIGRKSGLFLVLSGFATGGSWLCYYKALQTGPASVVVPIDKLSIVVTVAFSVMILREKMTPRSVAGLAGIVAGTLLLLV